MKKFLIVIGILILACLVSPIGWWILIGMLAFIAAVFGLIFDGIASLFSGISFSGMFAGAGIWPFLAIAFIIIFIVLVIYIICS
jgi:hypothetical protein